METINAIKALAALAQESRLTIFRLLVEQGPMGLPVGKIGERTGIAPATLSFHLKDLSHAGLISAQQNGRSITYSANFMTMNELVAFLTENCCGGNAGLCVTEGEHPELNSQDSKLRAVKQHGRTS